MGLGLKTCGILMKLVFAIDVQLQLGFGFLF